MHEGSNLDQGSMATSVLFLSDHLGHAAGARHGASTYFLNVLPELRRADLDCTVCFLRERHCLAEELERNGVSPVFLGRGKWDLRALSDLIKLIRERNITLVHAAGMKGILIGGLAAKYTGCRFIAHLHDANPVHPVARWGLRIIGRWMEAGICISRSVLDFAQNQIGWPAEKLVVLYNPLREGAQAVDAASITFLREDLGLLGKKVFLVVGRFSEEKGHESLLREGAKWLLEHPEAQLVFAGDGPLRPAIEQLIQDLHLRGQVTVLGFRDDVDRWMRMADVLLIPSIREGLGYVAMEAMAGRCPVVAKSVGGLPELIQNGINGMLADTVPEMLQKAWEIAHDTVLRDRLVENGYLRAEDFSLDRHIEELKALYR